MTLSLKQLLHVAPLALAFSAQAATIPPYNQHILAAPTSERVKVPGHNNAYYTQIDASEQLFGVRELVVYPNPPKLNQHIFLYLDGWISDSLPDLADATLEVSGVCPAYWGEGPAKITDYPRLVVRHEHEYGGPLRSLANNELILDWMNLYWSPDKEKWNCSVEATARLPDKRILFSFAQNFTLQYPPTQDGSD